MSSSLLVNSIGEGAYDEYIEKLMNIYRLSSKDSSIIGHVQIIGEKSKVTLSIVDRNGYSNNFTDIVFRRNENFYERFIKEIIKRMNSECHILVNDLVGSDNEKNVTYRMITENNDMFTIEGLDRVRANQIVASYNKEEECEPKLLLKSSNLGEGNYLIFITMIVIIILTLILICMMMK